MSIRSNGSYIGPRPSGPSSSEASGIWDLRTAERQTRASAWPQPVVAATDPDFANVSLLLHMDGSNGSTTFTDSSSGGLTVTPSGDAQVSTAQSKFGGASALFDGTGDYLNLPDDTSLTMGTGDFTIEFWIYPINSSTSASNNENILNGSTSAVLVAFRNTNQFSVGEENVAFLIDGSMPASGEWTHVAISRDSTGMRLFLNGTQTGSTDTSGTNFSSPQRRVGAKFVSTAQYFNGYIDELRITKGVARYTTTFTPPTAAFPDS